MKAQIGTMENIMVLAFNSGLESPNELLLLLFVSNLPPFVSVCQGSLAKLTSLLKKNSMAKAECGTVMGQALQALKAAKPLKIRLNKALKA